MVNAMVGMIGATEVEQLQPLKRAPIQTDGRADGGHLVGTIGLMPFNDGNTAPDKG
jgi:hypothetical protein